MERWVDISFDCLPLRTVGRLDIPLDASPKYRQRCETIKAAIEKHGSYNAYFLYNARCVYHLVNASDFGTIEFRFEGTVITDAQDAVCQMCDLDVELHSETCEWLTKPITDWFAETVLKSVTHEFNRYIEAGSLEQTRKRIEEIQSASDDANGFVGMYL